MINEERVKELYQMALYDKEHDSMEQKAGRYFKSDYISGQLVKSFITGTVAFAMLLVLWGMSRLDKLFDLIGDYKMRTYVTIIVMIYIAFMIIYLLVTFIVYSYRYKKERQELKDYYKHLKKVMKMNEREEKLK